MFSLNAVENHVSWSQVEQSEVSHGSSTHLSLLLDQSSRLIVASIYRSFQAVLGTVNIRTQKLITHKLGCLQVHALAHRLVDAVWE